MAMSWHQHVIQYYSHTNTESSIELIGACRPTGQGTDMWLNKITLCASPGCIQATLSKLTNDNSI